MSDREKALAWDNTNEQMAAAVEALWRILARLEAGVPIVQVKRTRQPAQVEPYPRPEWVAPEDDVVVVTNVADAIRMMKGGPRVVRD